MYFSLSHRITTHLHAPKRRSDAAVPRAGGTQLSLDKMQGVLFLDTQRHRVVVEGGIRLYRLVDFLNKHGYDMLNLGSVVAQSIAGAISTGTHGTGATIGA